MPADPSDGLPPDPGQAGDATLEGIDSDEDGLRDDVQRRIAQTSDDPDVQASLRAFALTGQRAMAAAASGEDTAAFADEMFASAACLAFAHPEDGYEASVRVEAALANTLERSRALAAVDAQSSGDVFSLPEDPCTPTVVPAPTAGRSGSLRAAIVFANGMGNSRADAGRSLVQLRRAVEESGGPAAGHVYTYDAAYNEEESRWSQLHEVGTQAGTESWELLRLGIYGLAPLPPWFDTWLAEYVTDVEQATWVDDDDFQSHLALYRNLIDTGWKVVVVAHSQGNFYTNEACRRIDSPSFGMVSVASPAATVCGRFSPYTLNADDLAISGLVRLLRWTVLPPNVSPSLAGTLSGHAFVEDYLEGARSGPRITDHIRSTAQSLEQPDAVLGTGPLRFTLRWGSEPDLDLHVYEPDGTHVYYAQSEGASGTLDVDDVDGFGPENYFVPIERLQEGTYWIGVNYFSGDGLENARLQVATPVSSQPFSRPILSARGPAGDDAPLPMAEVEVSRVGSQYAYRVRSTTAPPPTSTNARGALLPKQTPRGAIPSTP